MFKKISGVLVSVAPLSAFAAVPAAVSTSVTDAGTDAATIAGLVLVAIIGLLAFKLMRKGAQ